MDRKQVEKCRQILDSDHATNFETRMVAEVMLYWIIYESCSSVQVDLPKTQAALHEWRQEWKFLFGKSLPTRSMAPLIFRRSTKISISSNGLSLCSTPRI